MYKATLTFSLLFLAIVGSAQSDGGNISAQPQSSPLPAMQTVVPHPSGSPISMPPPSSDSAYNSTKPNGFQPDSGIPTGQHPPNGVVPSATPGPSDVPKPNSAPNKRGPPNSEPAMPNTNASLPALSDGALPTATPGSKPDHHMAPNGSQPGNFTFTPSSESKPDSSGPVQPNLPVPTSASYGKLD